MHDPQYLIWQLVDSAFPSGSMAHSNGLEAAWQHGHIRSAGDLREWLGIAVRQAGRGTLPFVMASSPEADEFELVDRHCDAFLLSHVANRASRAQGQALLSTAARVFPQPEISTLRRAVRERRLPAHLAPAFGAVGAALGLARDDVGRLFLFTCLRGMMSGAVRLGIVGPLEGQRIQLDLYPDVARTFDTRARLTPDDAAQTSPVAELLQSTQDRLYSKLFVS
jgi:urease accessory protein